MTEFFDGAVELGAAEVDDGVIDDGLGIIRKLWHAGLAHRDVKLASNLLVRDGQLLLIDVAFAEARPSPWRQAVDLANMMLCLALHSSPERVYRRALRQFSVEEISEGFAAARGLALPSQLRRMLHARGRDLHAEFTRLLPAPPQPIGSSGGVPASRPVVRDRAPVRRGRREPPRSGRPSARRAAPDRRLPPAGAVQRRPRRPGSAATSGPSPAPASSGRPGMTYSRVAA